MKAKIGSLILFKSQRRLRYPSKFVQRPEEVQVDPQNFSKGQISIRLILRIFQRPEMAQVDLLNYSRGQRWLRLIFGIFPEAKEGSKPKIRCKALDSKALDCHSFF